MRTGALAEPTPLKSEPTIVTASDITDYMRIIVNLMKSLHSDMLANIVYRDPELDHNEVETLLAKAEKIDGCDQGLTCPGWQEDSESEPGIMAPVAAAYRREAFQHRVDARLMEDRIAKRSMTNAQIAKDLDMWDQWLVYKRKVENFLKSLEGFTIVKSSDFSEAQRLDLELQQFRQRYTNSTGLDPSMPLTPVPPPSDDVPWGWIGAGIAAILAIVLISAPSKVLP